MSAKSKAAAKVAGKAAGRTVPGLGQVLMVAEGAPVGIEELQASYATYSEGQRKASRLAREGKKGAAAKEALRSSLSAQYEAVRGAGRTAISAVLAKEAADGVLPARGRRSRKKKKSKKGKVVRMKKNGQAIQPVLQDVLAQLRALHWLFTTTHWQASGANFYGDHILFERLYTGKKGGPNVIEEMDQLAEKMVYLYGPASVAPVLIADKARGVVGRAVQQSPNPVSALLHLEKELQAIIKMAWKLNQQGAMDLGLDDYLMGLANERQVAMYLLNQRLQQG